MIFLEATMIVIGLAAVIISFRISDKKVSNTAEVDMEANMQKFDEVKEELSQKAESILESTDDKLSTLSNEKIMGMNEYSDQVMDKIEKNHAEVVFLYDMLNEKQEEVKQLVHDIDSLKAEIHNEAAKGYQSIKEQERQLDELKKDMETESLRLDQDKKEIADKTEKERTDIAENKEDDVEQEFHTLLEGTDHDEKSAASVFDEEIAKIEEEELATSIRSLGVIQPITLKETGTDKYMIISGERRYRASLMAGLERIPAYIKTAADENVVEMALIENIQREDLNSIEIALAYQKLIDSYGLTQEKLSERVGKKRATIANYLRLLKLPAEIQVGLKDKKIDMGHARALLPVEDPEVQLALYEQILVDGLSVRNVEEIVRGGVDAAALEQAKKEKPAQRKPKLPEEFNLLKDHLSSFFNTKVQLVCNEKGKGKITIPFASEDELERLIGLLDKLK